jgi:hypothetical protein
MAGCCLHHYGDYIGSGACRHSDTVSGLMVFLTAILESAASTECTAAVHCSYNWATESLSIKYDASTMDFGPSLEPRILVLMSFMLSSPIS